jgi:restriction system protein
MEIAVKPRRHIQSERASTMAACDLPMWRGNLAEEEEVRCVYCGCMTDDHHDPDRWNLSFEAFKTAFDRVNKSRVYGLPKEHPHSVLSGDIVERKVCLHICPMCGWWIAEDRAVLSAVRWQHWAVTLASAPALVELDLNNIELPIQEVRNYLAREFERRAVMHPRLFELTVASVFADFGYAPLVTAYSNDGGVDVILQADSGERIGVQVKRQRSSVGVEQIRAFLGALVLGGFRRGAFVSSSRFSRGAIGAARRITEDIMPIELIDSEQFFNSLGSAQLAQAPTPEQCIEDAGKLKFHLQACYNLNSL